MSQIYPGNACNDKHPTNIAHSDQLTEITKVFIVIVIHLSILNNENLPNIWNICTSLHPAKFSHVSIRQQNAKFLIAPSVISCKKKTNKTTCSCWIWMYHEDTNTSILKYFITWQWDRSNLSISGHCCANFCRPRSVILLHSDRLTSLNRGLLPSPDSPYLNQIVYLKWYMRY